MLIFALSVIISGLQLLLVGDIGYSLVFIIISVIYLPEAVEDIWNILIRRLY